MSGGKLPTRAELGCTALTFTLSGGVAFAAASLIDADQPEVGRLVWWMFFAAALITGTNWSAAWLQRRDADRHRDH
ncbi:hypothetical protein [Kitasatospora sp. NPDC088351]|uniref:hypothetical protein n=1 Tax=unclassified Kitasatospora TaxID=2633591 RepID=UPI0034407DB3